MSAGWETQVAGHELGPLPMTLDLSDFPRSRARVLFEFEFWRHCQQKLEPIMATNSGWVGMVGAAMLAASVILRSSAEVSAQGSAVIEITVKNHRFQPTQPHASANRPLTISIKNLDTTLMEFESVSRRVEKFIPASGQGTVHVRPLAPGQYEFFDDFHSATTGTLVVQ